MKRPYLHTRVTLLKLNFFLSLFLHIYSCFTCFIHYIYISNILNSLYDARKRVYLRFTPSQHASLVRPLLCFAMQCLICFHRNMLFPFILNISFAHGVVLLMTRSHLPGRRSARRDNVDKWRNCSGGKLGNIK